MRRSLQISAIGPPGVDGTGGRAAATEEGHQAQLRAVSATIARGDETTPGDQVVTAGDGGGDGGRKARELLDDTGVAGACCSDGTHVAETAESHGFVELERSAGGSGGANGCCAVGTHARVAEEVPTGAKEREADDGASTGSGGEETTLGAHAAGFELPPPSRNSRSKLT